MSSRVSHLARSSSLMLVLLLTASIAFIGVDATLPVASADEGGIGPEVFIGPVVLTPRSDWVGGDAGTPRVGHVIGQDRGDGVVRFTYVHERPREPIACDQPATGVSMITIHPPLDGNTEDVHEAFLHWGSSGASDGLHFWGGGTGQRGSWHVRGYSTSGGQLTEENQFRPGDTIWVEMQLTEGSTLADLLAVQTNVPRSDAFYETNTTMFSLANVFAGWDGSACEWNRFRWLGGGLSTEPAEPDPEFEVVSGEPGEFSFVPNDTTSARSWSFGDGVTSTVGSPTHSYELPGSYTVTHCLTEWEAVCHELELEVAPPTLTGSIEFIQEDEGADRFRVGETFGVRLVLEASEGVGDLELSFDPPLDTWLDDQELLEVDVDELPELPETVTMEPDSTTDLEWQVKALAAGDFEVTTTVTATDASDRESTPVVVTGSGTVEGMSVTITPDPRILDLNEDEGGDNRITVTVRVANETEDTTLEDVVLAGGMDALSLTGLPDEDGVSRLVVKIVEYPQRLDPTQSAPPDELDHADVAPEVDLALGDLGPGESASAVWVLEGFLPDDLLEGGTRLRSLAHGVVDGERVDLLGETEVRVVSEVLLEFGMRPERTQLLSGQTARFSGLVRNLSEDVTLGFAAVPVLDGNAGNGHVFPAGSGGLTPVSPLAFRLAPEQTIDLSAVLATIPSAVASEAKVEWVVQATRLDEETGTWTDLAAGQIRTPEVGEGQAPYDTDFRVSVAPSEWLQPGPDCGVGWFSCGAVEALDQLMTDIPHMAAWLWSTTDYSPLGRMGQLLGALSAAAQEGLNGDDEVMAEIVQEVIQQIYDEHMAAIDAGLALPETADGLRQAIGEAAGEWTFRIIEAVETGDLETLQEEAGRFVGGNPDLAFAPVSYGSKFVARLASNVHSANSQANRALRRAEQARQTSLTQRLNDAAAEGRRLETAVHVGDKLTLPLLQRVWGASPQNVQRLMEIANANEVIIVFRSRWPQAAARLEAGLARAKPELFKMKSVSEVDVRYLGYPNGSEGYIRVVEPPRQINPNLTGDALNANVERYIDQHLVAAHPELTATGGQLNEAREVVRKRLVQRTEEWVEFALPNPNDAEGLSKLHAWEKRGVDTTFDVTTQGLPDAGGFSQDIRRVELGRTRVGPDDRLVYEVKLGGRQGTPDANRFLDVTGDLDIVGILDKAGGFITDPNVRLKVYQELAELLDMQHGETLSLLRRDLQIKWMKGLTDGPNAERLVAVNPTRDVRAATLAESLAVTADSPNARLRSADPTGDYILLQGTATDVVARQGATRALTRRTWAGVLQDFYRNWTKFLPGRIINLLTGLPEGTGASDEYTRDESIVLRPSDGALERWSLENGWEPITIEDAIDLGDPDTLEMSPYTMTSGVIEQGSTVIPILELVDLLMSQTSAFFQAGDLIAIAPGTDREELRRIVGFGSLVIDEPLTFAHDVGTAIVLVEPAGGWPEPDLTDPDQPDQPEGEEPPAVDDTSEGTPAQPDPDQPDPVVAAQSPVSTETTEGELAQTGRALHHLLALALLLLTAGTLATRLTPRRRPGQQVLERSSRAEGVDPCDA